MQEINGTEKERIHESLRWLGDVTLLTKIAGHVIVQVLHNKIVNRKEDRLYYHVWDRSTDTLHDEHYPNFELALLAVALLRQGKPTDSIMYMARVGKMEVL